MAADSENASSENAQSDGAAELVRSFASIQLAFTLGQSIAAGITRDQIIEILDETISAMNQPPAAVDIFFTQLSKI